MAAKMVAVGGIELDFAISRKVFGVDKCSKCYYPRKSQVINVLPFYTVRKVFGVDRIVIYVFTLERDKEIIYYSY